MSQIPSSRTSGFSLLEVMIGATLMAVVAIVVSQGFVSLMRLDARSARHHQAMRELSNRLHASNAELQRLPPCPSQGGTASPPSPYTIETVCLVQRSQCGDVQGVWRCEGEGDWLRYEVAAGAPTERVYVTMLRRLDAP